MARLDKQMLTVDITMINETFPNIIKCNIYRIIMQTLLITLKHKYIHMTNYLLFVGSAHHSPPTGSLSNLVEVGTRGKV